MMWDVVHKRIAFASGKKSDGSKKKLSRFQNFAQRRKNNRKNEITKNIKKMKSIYIPTIISLLLLLTACEKDFETINQNPYNPTETSMEALFNGVVSSLQLTWNGQFYVDNEILYDVTQLGALSSRAWGNTAIGIDDIWNNYYGALRNVRELEQRLDNYEGDQAELTNVRAMLKVILAYKTFFVTDLFGDIPFFDAGKGAQSVDNLRPKYDSQEAIYTFLLDELAWVDSNIDLNPVAPNGNDYYRFGSFDALFENDLTMWRKFANALRLRYAIRIVDKAPDIAEPIIADIINNNLPIIGKNEDVLLRPAALGFSKESTHWSFREHRNLRMGSTIWNVLAPNSDSSGNGIIDPRTYLFFDTNNDGEWVPYPNDIPSGTTPPTEGGIPYGGQRDNNFIIKGADNKFSSFHYYMIRDDKDIPEILMTSAEVFFHKSEAYKRGLGVTQDDFLAETEYTSGIASSIEFWYKEADNCTIWENAPTVSNNDIFGYAFSPEVSLSNNGFPLDFIYKQEWLCYFRQPWEAFSLWRRTMNTPREGTNPSYYRLNYPASERDFNATNLQTQLDKMGGEDANNVKVWWMVF